LLKRWWVCPVASTARPGTTFVLARDVTEIPEMVVGPYPTVALSSREPAS